MKVVYGTLKGQTIHSDEGDFPLIKKSSLRLPYKGWFQVEKIGDKWKIGRTLYQDHADSYIDEDGHFVERNTKGHS